MKKVWVTGFDYYGDKEAGTEFVCFGKDIDVGISAACDHYFRHKEAVKRDDAYMIYAFTIELYSPETEAEMDKVEDDYKHYFQLFHIKGYGDFYVKRDNDQYEDYSVEEYAEETIFVVLRGKYLLGEIYKDLKEALKQAFEKSLELEKETTFKIVAYYDSYFDRLSYKYCGNKTDDELIANKEYPVFSFHTRGGETLIEKAKKEWLWEDLTEEEILNDKKYEIIEDLVSDYENDGKLEEDVNETIENFQRFKDKFREYKIILPD